MRLGKCSCAKVSALTLLPLLAAVFIGCGAAALPDQGAAEKGRQGNSPAGPVYGGASEHRQSRLGLR